MHVHVGLVGILWDDCADNCAGKNSWLSSIHCFVTFIEQVHKVHVHVHVYVRL